MATTLPNTGAVIPVMTEPADQAVNNAAFTAIDAAIGGIIESGSNANGSYVKFADGTMICEKLVSIETVSGQNNLSASNVPLPATFVSGLRLYASVAGTPYGLYMAIAISSVSNSAFNISAQTVSGTFGGITSVPFAVMAIGRWK